MWGGKGIGKNWTGEKALISASGWFLTAMGEALFLGGRLGVGLCLHPILIFSKYSLVF